MGVRVVENNHEVCAMSDVVVVALPPQILEDVLTDLKEKVKTEPKIEACLLLSIVSGKAMALYEKYLPNSRVARVVPNAAARVGAGTSVYVLNGLCGFQDGMVVEAVMGACGIVERVPTRSCSTP